MKRFVLLIGIFTLFISFGFGFQKDKPLTVVEHPVIAADFQQIAGQALQNYQFAQQATALAESKEEIARRDYVDALNRLKVKSGVPADQLDDFDLQQVKDTNGQVGLKFVQHPTGKPGS